MSYLWRKKKANSNYVALCEGEKGAACATTKVLRKETESEEGQLITTEGEYDFV